MYVVTKFSVDFQPEVQISRHCCKCLFLCSFCLKIIAKLRHDRLEVYTKTTNRKESIMKNQIENILHEPETIALWKEMEKLSESVVPLRWNYRVTTQLGRLFDAQEGLIPDLVRAELIKGGFIPCTGEIVPLEQRLDEQLRSIRTRFRNVYDDVLKELGDNIRKEEH